MDIIKIIKNIRQMRIYTRLNKDKEQFRYIKYQLEHDKRNLLNLDTSNSDISSLSDKSQKELKDNTLDQVSQSRYSENIDYKHQS